MTLSQFVQSSRSLLLSLVATALVAVPALWAANVAPQITSITGNGTFSAGMPNSVRLNVTGTPTPTLSVTGTLPVWANVDLAAGVISGTPPIGTDSSWPIVATATNSVGSASHNFTLHARPLSTPVTGLSTRLQVTSNGVTVMFSISGGARTVLLRAVGPSLAQFSVSGVLADPQLQLSEANSGTVLRTNDNWNAADAATMAQAAAFPLVSGARDAALVVTLDPGFYRAKISGVGQTTGISLVELYDVTGPSANTSAITYLALHGQTGSGNDVMTTNLLVSGSGTVSTMIRSVARANGSDAAVSDPTLIVYSNNTLMGLNYNWGDGGFTAMNRQYEAKLGATPLVTGSLDSVIHMSMTAGSYLVYPASNGLTGAVLLEFFPAPDRDLVRPALIDVGSGAQTLMAGQAGTLAPIISGTGLTYQWRKNGTPMPGETKATLTFASPSLADQGSYDLVATNAAATAVSMPITVSVIIPVLPTIVSQPVSGEFFSGDVVKFSVVCSGGTAPLSYQWRKNGVPISGARNADHILRVTTLNYDVGAYDVVITNPAGSITSERATLAMGQLPFATSPAQQYVRLGDPVTLGAHPTSNVTITHSWYKDNLAVNRPAMVYNLEGVAMGEIAAGQPVPAGRWMTPGGGALYLLGLVGSQEGQIVGAGNNRTYVIPSVSAGDLGEYSVDVTISSVTERRGPASVVLRGNGALGRRFVAVGANGKILRSYEGNAWTNSVSGVATELRGVAVKGDAAIAVGVGGALLRSINLDTWTRMRNTTVEDLNAVVAGPDRFVAVGAGGRVLVSTDGVDWYHGRHITHATLTGVAYGNGVYVMTGANGAVFASVDGFKWVNRNSETRSGIEFVTFAGNQFWALGGGYVITSPDGLTWSRVDATQPVWFRSLAYDGSSLVAVGTGGRVYTSANGVSWTPRISGTAEDLLAVTWSGTEVPGGFSPTAVLSDMDFRILTPPFAVNATLGQPAVFRVTTTGAPTSYQWHKGGTPIDGATGSTHTIPSVQLSDAGGYWVKVTSTAGEITSATAGLQFRGGGTLGSQFIAVGDNGVILTSPDGLQFTERSHERDLIWRAVAASAFRAVAVGKGNIVATSTDGVTWIRYALSLPGAGRILRGVASGVSQFVAVGSAGTIVVTFDGGDAWKLVPSGTTQGLWSVAWDGARFVAVGEGGIVLTSPDGLTWTAGTSPTNQRLYAIHANGSKLIAVTEQGAAYETGNSGATWTPVGVSGDLWVRGATVASGGRRVIVGDRGMISTSAGGSVWNLSASPTSARLYGVTWTGALGVVGGDLSTAMQAPTLRILSQPQAVAGFIGGTASFSVTTGGVGPYEYQWMKNGVELPQQTQSTLFLSNLQSADAGSYSVEVRNAQSVVTSTSAALTVSVGSGSAPTLASSPASRSVSVGGATNFVVAADGQAPFTYRWYFNGNPISGAVSTTLALSNVQMANAGSYTVTVSNRYGSVTSAPAALTVTSVPGMPVISQQPASQAVAANGVAVFTVVATGTPAPSYQWRKDGVDINNATQATLTVDPVQTANSGVYTVRVSNTVGEVISEPASLTVVPAGTVATHRQTAGRGYEAGGTVTIASTLTFVGQAQSAGWEVLLPAGWSYVSGGGAQGDIRPAAGETQLLSWAWTTPPASPIAFTYTLQVPAGTTGAHALAALAVLRQGGVPIRLMAQPDPLIVAPASTLHAADTSGDQRIDLFELTRVIELYNTRNGSVRTGAYRVDSAGEDGFAGDSARAANSAATLVRYHSADTRGSGVSVTPDGALDLIELTRVIELYNQRAGNVRTGQYRVQSGTEDGFAPGP